MDYDILNLPFIRTLPVVRCFLNVCIRFHVILLAPAPGRTGVV